MNSFINHTSQPPRALFIAGPTASGKSAIALAIAKLVNGCIINADSMQVYDNGARIVFGGAAKMIIKNSNVIAPTSKTVDTTKTTKAKS